VVSLVDDKNDFITRGNEGYEHDLSFLEVFGTSLSGWRLVLRPGRMEAVVSLYVYVFSVYSFKIN